MLILVTGQGQGYCNMVQVHVMVPLNSQWRKQSLMRSSAAQTCSGSAAVMHYKHDMFSPWAWLCLLYEPEAHSHYMPPS